MAELAEALGHLTPKQRDLLLRRLERQGMAAPGRLEADRIGRLPRNPDGGGELPVSFTQQRLWFLDRLQPGSPLYNLPSAIEAEGRLELAALAASLREIVRRHEALRTTFAARAGAPVQVVHAVTAVTAVTAAVAIELPVVDLAGLPPPARQAEAQRLATAEARRPFDLARGPLMRSLLLRLASDHHLAVLTLHHIVSDGWSMGVLVREIAALYPAFLSAAPSPLPALPVQCADFAAWQRERLEGEALERELAFWRAAVAGAPLVLDLPTDRPRPAVQTFRGAQAAVRLEPELVAALRERGRASGYTLFMLLLGAFEVLLARWTGQEALLVGTPVAGRARPEVQGLIGLFVNTLPLRADLAGEPSLGELLKRVKQTELAAFAHQDLPFGRLVEELHPDRDLSRSPLFQVMFALQRAEAEGLRLPGLTLRPRDLDTGTAKFELTLQLAEGADTVAGWIEHNSDLFDAATVERMADQLATLLRAFPGGPERPVSELPLLPAAERRQLLADWNATRRPWPAETLVHELFERQVERTPEAPAVGFGGETLTYRELDERANRLARTLRRRGIGPEARVGLCAERSAEMVVALLGILKAGGAYVPLDPAHPTERIRLVLEDSGVAVLLAEQPLLAGLPAHAAEVICLDRDAASIATEDGARLPRFADTENLAYVLYTSGSTGRPKGVQLPHRALVNLLRSVLEWPGVRPDDTTLALTTLTFDVAAFEIYAPLAVGGRVEVATREEAADGRRLAARIAASRPTVVQGTPATWRLLVDSGWRGSPEVRAVTAGEPLARDLAEAVLDRCAEFWNLYGPTEAAVYSAGCRVARGDGPVVFGRPVANTELYVADARLAPVPLGAAGELLIGGAGLARGYLGRPDLTAEKFVPHPWSEEPGARLYRTGDLVRYRPGGDLEYLGRIDQQVKVRGFRIELGEVETALRRCPGVRQAAVVAHGEGADRRLVAYLIPQGATPGIGELREHLRRTLPDYMIPAAFVALDVFPLTPSGKVDRKSLPAPEGSRETAVETVYAVPRTELERTIAGIWRDALKLDRVGVGDNFFDLGGHSLLAAQVHARLGEVLGREVALVDLFRYPTVASLAAFLGGGAAVTTEAGMARAAAREAAGGRQGAVAIIGMAGRFPGANGIEAFWDNLKNGVESISFFSDEELRAAGVPESALADPRYVRARGVVAGADEFDAPFFGYSPREAELIDPQQRLFLECAWEAFEDAGHEPSRFAGDVGVFAGAGMNTYVLNFLADPEVLDSVGNFQLMISNDKDFLAPRVSYKLGLTGPSLSVQTACSTSLVAVHLACQSLLAGECDAALAGGVSLRLPQTQGYHHHDGAVFSPDGHCRAFDAAAGGFVGGNGAAVVLLRRLSDALRDGDRIRAVIRGSAVNNDGSFKAGFTAPSVDGQAQVIAQALKVAGVEPETIGYVEAHGTGTELGDPIEVAALTQAFGSRTRPGGCLLGSAKSNVGHLDSAAGVTGLIKAALALERGQIPPTLHFARPNPKLRLEETPFRVADRLMDWPAAPSPRRAGVSSLGIGGTNAHVVLEEPPPAAPRSPGRAWKLLPLSARSDAALNEALAALADHLRRHPRHPETDLDDAAYTLQVGRRRFERRAVALCRDAEDAVAVLAGADPERLLFGAGEASSVAFLFSGQGSQYPGMAAELYGCERVFRDELDRACEGLSPWLGLDLRTLLFPAAGEVDAAAALARTEITQPALFAVEHALARQWMAWGIRPAAMLGHSIGEYVAACLAGVFSFDDALALVAERGRLMSMMEPGAMLAVSLPEADVLPLLGRDLSLAAVNGTARTVVSGPETAVAALESELAAQDLRCRRLHTSHAFHSTMMEPALEPFAERARRVRLSPSAIPFVSNVSGTWIAAGEATDPAYWARHLRATVRFADGIAALQAEPGRVLLEVGPGNVLATLAREAGAEAYPSLPHPQDRRSDLAFVQAALGRLWLAGAEVDWQAFHGGERRRRVPLPTYPFERRRYWPQGGSAGIGRVPAPSRGGDATGAGAARAGYARPELQGGYVEPRDEAERAIAAIWQDLLGLDRVGVHDNFFDLGGHSLVATQVMSRLRASFSVDLGLGAFFSAPTVAGLAGAVSRPVVPVTQVQSLAVSLPPISAVPRDGGAFPLSYAQERMWFLHQLDPKLTAYNLVESVHLRGILDPQALEHSINALARRHEILRTVFVMDGEGPRQSIQPPAPIALIQVDLRSLDAGRRLAERDRCLRMLEDRPLDLVTGPLFRIVLLELAEDERLLVFLMHHIVSDGWSMRLVVREMAALYAAAVEGRPSPLPELAIQYADFAVWQRRWLTGEALAGQLDFWTRQLAGVPPLLELPTDRPRPALQSSRGARRDFDLGVAISKQVKEIGRRRGLTPFMTLLSGFAALLWRYTGAADFVVGVPIANRNRAEIETLIGTFVNMLALRIRRAAGGTSFLELAGQVREVALGAFAHQDLPFERLVDELRLERSLSHSPLFQVMFNLQNQPVRRVEVPGLIFSPFNAVRSQAQVDLTLAFADSWEGDRFVGFLEYNTDLFDAATIDRMAVHLGNLFAGAAAGPERPLAALPLFDPGERLQLLAEWNDSDMERPRGLLIHELFARSAAAAPEVLAVSCGPRTMTYGELDARSNRLANALRRRGVGPEVRVALCLERTPEMVVGLLGVLKAGGAYVPLDPSHPAERIALVLADAEAAVLVTEERWLALLPPHGAQAVCVDRDRAQIEAESSAPPPRTVAEENLAYVIYTSGSTGRPKGVQLPHRAVVNFLLAMLQRPGLTAADVVPAVTTLTFDIAGLEIYLPLAAGGRVEVVGREEASDGALLGARLKAAGATVLQATPATWRLLLDAGWEGQAGLKALCGGEALPRELAAALLPRVEELWNVYGPTETAIWSSAGRVASGAGQVPLGAPIGNTRFLVVDRDLDLVPVGVAGELWIAGDGVARGYLGRPDLTAEKFAPDPFTAEPGARLYRTGDLVRWRPSGEMEFLGRIDHQVKVRGFRIELGEIEAALLRHESVRAAVVVVREEGGDKRLVAYLVAGGEKPAAGELRLHLRDLLPDYMVPAAFVFLDSFPLTPSGKVDRKALPAPEAAAGASRYLAPRGPVEELVAGIWAEVLRLEQVGADDDFFDLGGHSLLATQVVSRLRGALGVEVPLQKLFAAPTVAAVARAAEEARARHEGVALPPIIRVPRQDSFPLSFSQQRMWFLHQLDPMSSAYNLGQAVRLRGTVDVAALAGAFGELVRRHEALRTHFRAEGGEPVQVVRPPLSVPLPVMDLAALPSDAAEGAARRLAADHQAMPFDLIRGPLLRVALLRFGPDEHALLLAIHHIVSDGWSFGVIVHDLVAFYGALVAGEPAPLPELPVQYPDFAVWQRRVLSGETLEAELAWWRQRLAGDPPPLRLPADRRRAGAQGFQAEWEGLELPAELVAGLRALSRRQGASLYMTLLAGWKALLARLTAEEELVVGAPIANRNRAEVEGLIGFFLNTLVLRTGAAGNPPFAGLLARVRETSLGAFAHQDLPLEMVLQALHPERDPARTSPFQVMFLLQNLPPQELAVPGLTFSVLEAEERAGNLGTAIFEVGLTVEERADGRGLAASITYNGLLFDRATAARLLDRYRRLLAGVAEDPARRFWEYDLLEEAEHAEILRWGKADSSAVSFVPVHRAFEERAATAPEAPAVIAGERRLTYGELDRRANRLAHALRALGVGPGRAAGVSVERSPELLVALLGVLKAGGAYAPLDPSYPPERLRYILQDAGAAVLLTTASVLEAAPALRDGRALPLLLDGGVLDEGREDKPEIEVDAEDLAYLIYTSGSTGRPKGVMVRHGALAGYVAAFRDEHRLGPQDRVLQFASIGFDTSAEEIYPCLTSGAALVLRDDAMLVSTPDFLEACGELGISVLDLPTAFWHGMTARLMEERVELPRSLRLIILGGERVLPERLDAWHELGHDRVRLVNTYGPTETTIVAARCELASGLAVPGEVPIGRPVSGARTYVADPLLELAPAGIPGELCVAGSGLARGYLGRPDLTAERFLPDPWAEGPGMRLYRTGDLVRWLPAGDLEFLGRIDDQVKVRGYRVELREIEASLGLHPAVAEAVVVAREDAPGDRRLTAYVVPRNGEAGASELRAFLRERLPDYMVPASFVALDALPTTPSGKVDRRALPSPDRLGPEGVYTAPRTPAEETVAAIWRAVLGAGRVGVTDNFFELGGHSLLLPQVMHRLRSAFRVEIPLRALFDEPTVEGLAIAVEEALLADIESQLEALEGADSLAG